jgi:hypothetical protein
MGEICTIKKIDLTDGTTVNFPVPTTVAIYNSYVMVMNPTNGKYDFALGWVVIRKLYFQ